MIRAAGLLAIAAALGGCGSQNHQAESSSSAAVTQDCTVSLVDHDARVEFVATDAREACADFARTHSTGLDNYWTTKRPGRVAATSIVICDVIGPKGGEAVVYDDPGGTYGTNVCDELVANGWRLRGS